MNAISKSLHEIIPGGAHTYSKGDDQFSANGPRYLERGDGVYVWDEKGTRFLDWTMGLRTIALGYGFKPVIDAAVSQIAKGSNFCRPSMVEELAAQDLISLVPGADMVKFAKNGSNVTTAAVKLARAYTGRDLVAICSDHPFFSFDDWFIGATPCDAGIPESTKDLTVAFRYNDFDSVERILETRGPEIACLIMEAVTSEEPKDDFLHKTREACRKRGIVFILDEMITGFRFHRGGAQAYFNLDPDLSTFGKAMGNGFAVAAVIGKREIMRLGGLTHSEPRVFLLSATHGAENHALAAMRTVIDVYRNEPVTDTIWSAGRGVIDGLNAAAKDAGIEKHFRAFGYPCSPYYSCSDASGVASMDFRTLFLQEMAAKGLLVNYFAPSYAHRPEHVEQTVEAARAAFTVYARALEDGVQRHVRGPSVKPVFRKYN